jgi:hypothetical protein
MGLAGVLLFPPAKPGLTSPLGATGLATTIPFVNVTDLLIAMSSCNVHLALLPPLKITGILKVVFKFG